MIDCRHRRVGSSPTARCERGIKTPFSDADLAKQALLFSLEIEKRGSGRYLGRTEAVWDIQATLFPDLDDLRTELGISHP
jgi:hypothetical protein